MSKGLFIAGTDTGIGKTVVTGLLAKYFSDAGFSVVTQKWVQTGDQGGLTDIDLHLKSMGSQDSCFERYSDLAQPYSFKFASSPHLAAAAEKAVISSGRIRESFLSLEKKFDVTLVEGTGGLLVPINEKELFIDVVKSLDLEVILVSGNRLGAINHTLLSAEALTAREIKVVGIIFNRFAAGGNEDILRDNRKIISLFSGLKDLGEVPCEPDLKLRNEAFSEIGARVLRAFPVSDEK
jgi:dethiobiotin synthetase